MRHLFAILILSWSSSDVIGILWDTTPLNLSNINKFFSQVTNQIENKNSQGLASSLHKDFKYIPCASNNPNVPTSYFKQDVLHMLNYFPYNTHFSFYVFTHDMNVINGGDHQMAEITVNVSGFGPMFQVRVVLTTTPNGIKMVQMKANKC